MIRSTLRSATADLWNLLLQILSGSGPEVSSDDDGDNRWQIDPNG
jgi:hypothetical protein